MTSRWSGLAGAVPRYFHLMRSQYWTHEALQDHVDLHLSSTLAAAVRIPFYKERFDRNALARRELSRLPVLPRSEVPQLTASVRSLHPAGTRFPASSRTSGSTGMPVPFLFDATHQAGRFAARARYLRENGWDPFRRSAWIISLTVDSPDAVFSRRSRLIGAHFFPHTSDLEQQAEWLRKLNPIFLYAYPVNLEGLVRIFETGDARLGSLQKIFSGSEVLDDSLRDRLRRVFGVPVADNYGSTEAFLAWECPSGSYHVNAEHVIVEVVDEEGNPALPGALGRVLVTTLENHLMPLVRYEIGDFAIAIDEPCRCGRTLPRLGKIVGRGVNLFVDRNGKKFVPWDLLGAMRGHDWIRQYQVAQRDIDQFFIRYAASRSFCSEDETAVRSDFERILGLVPRIEFERVERVPRAPSGKFMTALCEIEPPQQA